MSNFFFKVKWDDQFHWFDAMHMNSHGDEFHFLIQAEAEADIGNLEVARNAFLVFCANVDRYVDFMMATLIDVIGTDWGKGMSRDEFMELLTMDVFKCKLSGKIEVMFYVGDYFGDHRINLVLDSSLNPIVAKLDY